MLIHIHVQLIVFRRIPGTEKKSCSVFSFFFSFSRLRLKKEFDDFKKHPEYNNFVREECISSSSSSDEDDEDGDTRPEAFSLSDHYRRAEEEDLEHVVPRGLWSGGKIKRKYI